MISAMLPWDAMLIPRHPVAVPRRHRTVTKEISDDKADNRSVPYSTGHIIRKQAIRNTG